MFEQRLVATKATNKIGVGRLPTASLIVTLSILLGACSDSGEMLATDAPDQRPMLAQSMPAAYSTMPMQGAAQRSADNSGNAGLSANRVNPSRVSLPGNAMHMQRVEILDRQGFERTMVAATAMIPVGWQAQGGVVWSPSACGNGYKFNWSASSADGNQGIALFPGQQWTWSNFPISGMSCPTAQISSVREFLQDLVRRARPGARVIDFRPREDLAKPYQQLNSVIPIGSGELRSWVEAGEILIGYSNARGVEIRETAAVVAFFNLSRMSGINGGEMQTLSGQTLTGFAAYAPNGQLDFKADETMRKAIQPGADWLAKINNHNSALAKNTNDTYRNISRINADGARQRLALNARTSSEISDMQMESWKYKNELWDKQTRETGEMINEVETYDDPQSSTGAVQLSYNYKNAWRLDDGTYVLTDDANFQPYKDAGQFGQKLKVQE
ncbi:MAG TPA: hypothetical protein VFN25_14685 [Dokdonella sp.]|uniref:hypothetical protein n=1 Tax=Dokdonella sp. TaxID=2291710 RepID=UPI002D7EF6BC|nr:hypothetical protein [Dokdonella sp.]HET9034137.1 hypothetical protein [Dokdonella sp.]